MEIIYQVVPWIGVYSSYFSRTGRNDGTLVMAYVQYMAVIVAFNAACYFIWSQRFFVFGSFTASQLNLYYLYVQMMEMFFMLFVRTRISIRYLPRILTVLNVLFLTYYFAYFYPFCSEALFVLIISSVLTVLAFLRWSECPALEWNPFSPCTPSISNPRQAYIRVLESDFVLSFSLSTLFVSPAFRSEFSPEEQCCIDSENNGGLMFDFSLGQRDRMDQIQMQDFVMNMDDMRQELRPDDQPNEDNRVI